MDTSASRDSLNDTPILPELSFDDLLDVSPAKKDSPSNSNSDDPVDIVAERKVQGDETLNTPGPKKPPPVVATTTTTTAAVTQPSAAKTSLALTSKAMTVTNFKVANTIAVTATTPKTIATSVLLNSKNISTANTHKTTSAPVLLNSKNILPKTATTTFSSQVTKITTKSPTASNNSASSAATPTTSVLSSNSSPLTTIAGKTAIKAPNGQIFYIQKASSQLPGLTLVSTSTSAVAATSTSTSPSNAVVGGSKPMAIQLITSGDSKTLPVKTTSLKSSAGLVGGVKQTLTLSQANAAQLAGKKIMSTSSGQVIIKALTKPSNMGSNKTAIVSDMPTTTTPNITAVTANKNNVLKNVKIQKITTSMASAITAVSKPTTGATTIANISPTTPTGKIVVQNANGKQILVSNQSMFKLSPKPGITSSVATAGAGVNGSGSSATADSPNTIQLVGKSGMQVVRVVPGMKISTVTGTTAPTATVTTTPVKANAVASTINAVTSSAAETPTTKLTPITTTTATKAFKILNSSLPTKYAVLPTTSQIADSSKTLTSNSCVTISSVASKKEGSIGIVPITFSPNFSDAEKTNMTASNVRSIVDDKNKSSPSSGAQPTTSGAATTTGPSSGGVMWVRKHKFTEINSKFQRLINDSEGSNTASADVEIAPDTQTEAKKLAIGNKSNGSTGGTGVTISGTGGKRIYVMQVRNNLPSTTTTPGSQLRQGLVHRVSVQRPELNKNNNNNNNNDNNNSSSSSGSGSSKSNNVKNMNSDLTDKDTIQPVAIISNVNAANASTSTVVVPTKATTTTSSPKKYFSVLKQTSTANQQLNSADLKSQKIPHQTQVVLDEKQQQHSKSLLLKRTYQQQLSKSSPKLANPGDIQLQTQNQQPKPSTSTSAAQAASSGKLITATQIKDEQIDDIKPLLLQDGGIVRRKHCNCSKSQCLKLYCDCFANGEFCQDCTCKDCFNNLQYEDERQQAIKNCLERNPSAFKPKITTRDQGDMRLHNKGCNCKRSGCLKNYCECYEAKIPCSSNCKCVGCRNFEFRPDLDVDPLDVKTLATTSLSSGVTGQKRSYDKISSKSEKMKESAKMLNSELFNTASNASSVSGTSSTGQTGPPPEKQQCNLITQDVIDATIQCMISQGDECEKNGLPAYQTEKMVIEECGRCLVEIIDFSIRNTDPSYTQD